MTQLLLYNYTVTNVFPKNILKSKARDQSIQARKKLFCHVIVKNYLCNVLCKFFIKIESTWRREIKKQTPQLTLPYRGRTIRSSHRRCSIRKLFLKILQYPQETPVLESATLLKMIPTPVFSCEYCEIFNTTYLEKHLQTAAFYFFNGSPFHGSKGLKSTLHDGVRLHGPSHRSIFCF